MIATRVAAINSGLMRSAVILKLVWVAISVLGDWCSVVSD
jgi:hypothetical protein